MDIIDGQLHELGPRTKADVADAGMRARIMLETTLSAMDAVGVAATLLHPIDAGVADLALAEVPERFGVVLTPDPQAGDLEEQVATAAERPGVVGVRIVASFPPTGEELRRLEDGGYDRLLGAAQQHGLPLFILVSGHLGLLADALRRFPDLRVVIDHLGIPQPPLDPRDDPPFAAVDELRELAENPNTLLKVSGTPSLSLAGPPYDDVWPHVHALLEAFGVERTFWGSDIPRFQGRISWDFPIEHAQSDYPGKHTYAQSLALFRDTDQLSDAEKERLLGGTIREQLKWPA